MSDSEISSKVRECLLHLPVAINTNYGDAFQPSQWENTIQKVKRLKSQDHRGEVMIASKWVLTAEQISELYSINPSIWIFCGINGSNETKRFSTEERVANYLNLCRTFDKIALTLRPIIPGRNDKIEVLIPSIEAAAKGKGYLHHGGYRDPNTFGNTKYDYIELKPVLTETCNQYGVKSFPKSCCLAASYNNVPCNTCLPNEPRNLDVLTALGFRFEIRDGKVFLLGYWDSDIITKGDVSFVRHIIGSSLVESNFTDFHENMQMKGPLGQTLICTSSWFGWSRQWYDCEVGCDYCMVRPGSQIHYDAGDAGCSPLDLYEFLTAEGVLK